MATNLYVHQDGKNFGPLSADEVASWAREGRLAGDHYVWTPERGQWVRAADLEFLATAFGNGAEANYYVRISDDTIGPMDLNEVIRLIAERRFNAMDFIWLDGERRWARAGEVPFLSPHFLKQIREQVEEARLEKELDELDVIESGKEAREASFKPAWRTEAKRDLGRVDDRNYLKTLATMFMISILVITSVNFVEVPKPTEVKPAEVLSRVAKLMVDKPVTVPVEPLVTPEEIISTTGDGTGAGGGGGGGGQGGEDYASVGVVGLITSMGSDGTVADLMGAGGDLDSLASNIGGIKTGGTGTVGRGTGGGFGPGGPGLGGGIGGGGFGGLLGSKGGGTTKLKAGRVKVSPPGITGAAASNSLRSSAVIARIVNQRKQGIEYVYKKYLKTNPSLEGKVVVRFTIAASGDVSACSVVNSTMGHPQLESEICSRIMTWKFPPIDAGDVTVVYPFVFFAAGV